MVVAKWSGEFPNLCNGKWELYIDGLDVSNYIPTILRDKPMNTLKEYSQWHFNKYYIAVFDSYIDGMDCEDWIIANNYWLDKITKNINTQKEIFHAINKCDWRYGSCGGCI